MGSTCFDFWDFDKSGSAYGGRDGIGWCVCGFREFSHLSLLPGGEVSCGVCDLPGTLSRVSIVSPYVVGADEVASSSV